MYVLIIFELFLVNIQIISIFFIIFRFDDQKNVDSKFRKVQRDEAKQRSVAPQHEPR